MSNRRENVKSANDNLPNHGIIYRAAVENSQLSSEAFLMVDIVLSIFGRQININLFHFSFDMLSLKF